MLRYLPVVLLPLLVCIPARQTLASNIETKAPETASGTLPDSPGTLYSSSLERSSLVDDAFDSPPPNAGRRPVAAPYVKLIFAGQEAPKQQARDKVLLGLRESVTPFSMLGWLFSAGW